MSCVDWHWDKQSEDTIQTHISERRARKQALKHRRELAVSFTPPFPLLHLSLPPPSITPHVWDMLSWKRLAALSVYKRWRGFVQSLSFASRLLKQNKASRRKRTWEWKKWKLIIFLHVLPFISFHMYLSVLISFLSQAMTRFSLSHFDNKHQDEGESLIHSKTCERTHYNY